MGVTKALFYREKKHRLPDGYIVNAIHLSEVMRLLREKADFVPFIISKLNNGPRYPWGDAFAYSWVQSPNGSELTWWMLHFYDNPLSVRRYENRPNHDRKVESSKALLPGGELLTVS